MTWVHDQIYAAGGDHIPVNWESFAKETGVSAVLHLRPERPAVFGGAPPGVFLWLGVAEEGEARDQERLLAGLFLQECIGEGRKVLLHSSLGLHRTRWAFVAYTILAGRTADAALRQASRRPWLSPYHTDPAAWQRFARYARSDRLRRRATIA